MGQIGASANVDRLVMNNKMNPLKYKNWTVLLIWTFGSKVLDRPFSILVTVHFGPLVRVNFLSKV